MKKVFLGCLVASLVLISCEKSLDRPRPKLPPVQSGSISNNVFNSNEFGAKKASGPSSDAIVTANYGGVNVTMKGNLYIGDDDVARWDSYNGNGILWLDEIGNPNADKGINRATSGLTLADIRSNISLYQFYGIYVDAITLFMPISDLTWLKLNNVSNPWTGGLSNEVELTFDLLRQRFPQQDINIVSYYPSPRIPTGYDILSINNSLSTECASRSDFHFINISNLVESSSSYYSGSYLNLGGYNAIYYTVAQGTQTGGYSPNSSAALPVIRIENVNDITENIFVQPSSTQRTLNLSPSYDPDGTIASRNIVQVSGSTSVILNPTSASPVILRPTSGWSVAQRFILTATDAAGNVGVREIVIRKTF